MDWRSPCRRPDGAVLAFGLAGAHHRLAHLGDHRLDVGEVEIDQARHHDQVGDAAHAGMQHLVGHGESLGHGGAVIGDAEQILVGDDDQGMRRIAAARDARLGHPHAAVAFQGEGLGDHADGQDARLAHRAGDHRRGAGAGAAAHAGGDEHHVRAGELLHDLDHGFLGAGAADIGLGARAQTFGGGGAKLDAPFGLGLGQGLGIGVGHDEVDAFQARLDHVVDGIAAGAAHAQHRDAGTQFLGLGVLSGLSPFQLLLSDM